MSLGSDGFWNKYSVDSRYYSEKKKHSRFLIEGWIFLYGSSKNNAIGHAFKGQKDIVVRSSGIFHGMNALFGGSRIVHNLRQIMLMK